ncbi:MAG: prepilin-type N-terminal cleavage/methylation domain-containing protein [Candidatus Paceibacterota bacterium]|jgi:prepilin-type N-terminal cleavage/methylation domain-containing protein
MKFKFFNLHNASSAFFAKTGPAAPKKGFTLIELLVVIAIISLLSSVVMASVSSAKIKAKDAAIKAQVAQWVTLMGLNFDDYGSYCNLQYGWSNSGAQTCSTVFSGTYAAKARQICNSIYNNAKDFGGSYVGYRIYSYTTATLGCTNTYSFMVLLNNGKWFCSGSSGAKGEYATYGGNPGCFNNP